MSNYNGVTLDDDERATLSLPPKFMLFPEVNKQEIGIQSEVCNAKIRLDRLQNMDVDKEGNDVTEHRGEKVTVEQAVAENKHREIYNPEEKKVNFGGLRPTEVKNCPRMCMPGPRSVREEAEITTRVSKIEKKSIPFMNTMGQSATSQKWKTEE